MTATTILRPPHSLLLVMGSEEAEIPDIIDDELVIRTPSCIVVSTLIFADGETSVTIADDRTQMPCIPGLRKSFVGIIETPKRLLRVYTTSLDEILGISVIGGHTEVEIWTNANVEPDVVCILARREFIHSV